MVSVKTPRMCIFIIKRWGGLKNNQKSVNVFYGCPFWFVPKNEFSNWIWWGSSDLANTFIIYAYWKFQTALLFQYGNAEADSGYHAPHYSPPSSSYGAPSSSYNNAGEVVHIHNHYYHDAPPKPSYNPPKPSYNPPKPSYNAPSYHPPAPSYHRPTYDAYNYAPNHNHGKGTSINHVDIEGDGVNQV